MTGSAKTPSPPLTHHEIVGLVEPFTRRGRRIDLDATSRVDRRLAWRPLERPAEGALPPLREELQLEHPRAGAFRLTRTLTVAAGAAARQRAGLAATLTVEGQDPATLLGLVEAVPAGSQLRVGDGYAIAFHHRLEPATGPAGQPAAQLLVDRAVAEVAGLNVAVRVPPLARYAADLDLAADPGDDIALPHDLVAVLGWDFAPLRHVERGRWSCKLRLRGKGRARSRRAEERCEQVVAHLARTLGEPPARFHERHAGARFVAAARRMIPIFAVIGLVCAAMAVPMRLIEERPGLRILLMNGVLLLIGLSFTLQEQARFEIPPWPRRLRAASWRPPDVTLPAP